MCINDDYKCHYLFSQIYAFVRLKLNLFLLLRVQLFNNCNNRDSAGAELKTHAAPSNSVWIQNVDLFHCRSVNTLNHNFLITSNYNKTKLKYLALYCKRGNMFKPPPPQNTHTHTLTMMSKHTFSPLSV